MPPNAPHSLATRKPLIATQNQTSSPASLKPEKKAALDRIHQKLTGRNLQEETIPDCPTPERKEIRDERLNDLQAKVDQIKAARGCAPCRSSTQSKPADSGKSNVAETKEEKGWFSIGNVAVATTSVAVAAFLIRSYMGW